MKLDVGFPQARIWWLQNLIYVVTHKEKVKGESELQLKSPLAKLICANAPKYKPRQKLRPSK